jgi:hypothetical protein
MSRSSKWFLPFSLQINSVCSSHLSHACCCSVYSCCYAMTARWADIPGPFLGNASVNTFPLLGSRFLIMQQLDYNNGRAVFSTWSVPRVYKQDKIWSLVSWEFSSVRETVKRKVNCKSAQFKVRLWREDFMRDIWSV